LIGPGEIDSARMPCVANSRATPSVSFVAGFWGEQFALPEAIGMLRGARRRATADQWVSVSGADPLNLVGILTPGPKLPALAGNRLLYRDGIPTAVDEMRRDAADEVIG
jgi:hypothetical protein